MTHPASWVRLARHGVFELPVDVNGVPDGPDYETFLTVRDLRGGWSLRSPHPGVWSGRAHHLASGGEIDVKFALEANIFVLSIREGYAYALDGVYDDLHAGKKIARNRVATMDFAVTLSPLNRGGPLRYQVLSFKPHEDDQPAGLRREARDRKFFEQRGWSRHRVLRPPKIAVNNYRKLWDWGRQHPLDDGAQDARAMAKLLRHSESKRPLWSLLASAGKKLGIRDGNEFFVFAAAFYLGYIGIDDKVTLDEELALVQVPPPLDD